MINIEDVVGCLNHYITNLYNDVGFFVLQKKIVPDNTFKSYKKFTYIVWYVVKGCKQEVLILEQANRCISEEQEVKLLNIMDKDLIYNLFRFIKSDKFENIIKYGRCNINTDK